MDEIDYLPTAPIPFQDQQELEQLAVLGMSAQPEAGLVGRRHLGRPSLEFELLQSEQVYQVREVADDAPAKQPHQTTLMTRDEPLQLFAVQMAVVLL